MASLNKVMLIGSLGRDPKFDNVVNPSDVANARGVYDNKGNLIARYGTKEGAEKYIQEHAKNRATLYDDTGKRLIDVRKGVGAMKLLSDTSQPGMAISGAANASKPAPVFYSALEHATTNAAQETMSPQQWLGWLKNQPGVKQEELQWTGLDDWLAGQKGKVSKADVQRYLDEHKVEVRDVTKKSGDSLSKESLEGAVDTYIDGAIDDFYDEHGRRPSESEVLNLRQEIEEDIRANPHDYDLREYGYNPELERAVRDRAEGMTPEFIAEREELFGRPLTQEERHRVAQDAYRHARDNVMEDPEAFGA
jgi:hypothetical protein